jgi:hypothetical protein
MKLFYNRQSKAWRVFVVGAINMIEIKIKFQTGILV